MGFAALNPSYDAALLDRLGHGKTEIRLDKTLEALLGGRLAFRRETGILRALVVVCTIAPLPERVLQIFLGLDAERKAVGRLIASPVGDPARGFRGASPPTCLPESASSGRLDIRTMVDYSTIELSTIENHIIESPTNEGENPSQCRAPA